MGMLLAPVLALLIIGAISLLAVRIGGTALMLTGMSWDAASFQAYSAFFGVGFTTKEAEMVVTHPIRRRIIRDLILGGNVGLTSALAAVVVGFVQTSGQGAGEVLTMVALLIGVLVFLTFLARLGFLHRAIDYTVRKAMAHAGVVHAMDYDLLLNLQAGYCVSEVEILDDNPLAKKKLKESRPADMGIVILGIKREGATFEGVPGPEDTVQVEDVLTVYGKEEVIKQLANPAQKKKT